MNLKIRLIATGIALYALSASAQFGGFGGGFGGFGQRQQEPPRSTQGAFTTRQYRNYLLECGYTQKQIDQKLQEVFNDVFTGPHKCYFEVGDNMAYISDVKNRDVRTEGMSYGMMIAVQFDRKDIFDKLWRWCEKYMHHHDGALDGYFAWSCRTDGTRNSNGPASDGELYYVTSLIFASNRWGNDGEFNYLAEAQNILNKSMMKVGMNNTAPLINLEHKLITFTRSRWISVH